MKVCAGRYKKSKKITRKVQIQSQKEQGWMEGGKQEMQRSHALTLLVRNCPGLVVPRIPGRIFV